MRIAILGFGREGKAISKFLQKSPRYKKAEIKILDQKLDPNYLKNLYRYDLVFRSPGVPYNLPEVQRAIKKGVQLSSATKLFFDLCPATIIGVTGTKGKGTTSTLLYEILKACPERGRRMFLAGNIGKPAIDILPRLTKTSIVILELSSFQLQDLKKSPHIAVVVDTFPDHQDVHKNMKEYLDAKTNIARYQKKSDKIFYFKNNPLSRVIADQGLGKKIAVEAPDDLSKNKIMAATVAAHLHCPQPAIEKARKNFHGLEHRMEPVYSNVLKNLRISFYNDSASTNPHTAAAAIMSLSKNPCPETRALNHIVLIAGGKDKKLDYAPLARAIKKSPNVASIILFGENKEKIAKSLAGIQNKELGITRTKNLESAVKLAYQNAKKSLIHASSSIVLLSPGSASFDMFKDYADRGKQFKKIVKNLKL